MKNSLLFLLLITAILCYSCIESEASINEQETNATDFDQDTINHVLTKPYLQNVSTSGITIMWETDTVELGTIHYGTMATELSQHVVSVAIKTNASTYVHKAPIADLKPGTSYYYQLNSGGKEYQIQHFTTAPQSKTASFVVGIWGDSHYAEPWSRMADFMINEMKADLAFSTGDISNSGNKRADLASVFLPHVCERIGAHIPFYASLGNHDVGDRWDGGDLVRQYFDCPSEINSDQEGFAGSYLMMYGNVAFISIDWNKMENDVQPNAWLENVLKSNRVQEARYRFIFIHNAPFYERWQEAEKTEVKKNLPLLASKYKVNAIFSGHMHGYERGWLDGVNYITQGGGSYMDINESVGPRLYEHIIIGTNKAQNPENFNNGLVNHILTLHIENEKALVRLHYFDKKGDYRGVIETIEMKTNKISKK
ncbi:MAG: metallophosphoesterase [Mangrovibacterium sp.]